MNISEKDEKLMEFIYDEYKKSSSFQTHGEFASTLVSRFQDKSGIRFGDSGAQLEAMQRLIEKGWVEMVTIAGKRIGRTHLNIASRITPTDAGFLFVERKRQHWIKRHWPKIVSAVTEGAIRGFKK